MIFQHTLGALLRGEKTETSRLVKPGDYTFICGQMPAPWNDRGMVHLYSSVHHSSNKLRFERHKDYAIQPGRTLKSVGRFRVVEIWRQDVRTLENDQVRAEGFKHIRDFLHVWARMHDPALEKGTWGEVKLMARPAEKYMAWRLKIEVLWDTVDWAAPAIKALNIGFRLQYKLPPMTQQEWDEFFLGARKHG